MQSGPNFFEDCTQSGREYKDWTVVWSGLIFIGDRTTVRSQILRPDYLQISLVRFGPSPIVWSGQSGNSSELLRIISSCVS